MTELTATEARKLWDYDPETGVMRWKVAVGNVAIGDVVKSKHTAGYWQVCFNSRKMSAHRLIWLIVYGEWPRGQVDHINGVKDDNRLVNLRCVSHRQNGQNRNCHRAGHLPGTTYRRGSPNTPWAAQIQIAGKKKHLGLFPTEREAHEAYLAEISKLGAPDVNR